MSSVCVSVRTNADLSDMLYGVGQDETVWRGAYRNPATLSKTASKTTFWDERQCTMYLGESQCEVKGMFVGIYFRL